ncbi:hypothetical protein Q9314_13380 [Shinella sumterensis]|nr:hypothetical protein Q9314_13380 [Shinella sumterensis]
MTATIAIRPVTITAQTFTDGRSEFTSALHQPISAWGIFIECSDGTMSGLAPDRATALAAAHKMAEEHGWRITDIVPEGDDGAGAGGGKVTVQ